MQKVRPHPRPQKREKRAALSQFVVGPARWKPAIKQIANLRYIAIALVAVACGLFPLPCHGHGDVHGQILEMTQRIEKNPTNTDLYLARAELHRIHQDWDAAQADYDWVLQLNPKLDVIDFLRGRMYLEADWPLSAKVALDRFLAKHTNHLEALVTRARALTKLAQRLKAAQDYTRAINASTESRPELFIERAQNLAAEGGSYAKEALQGLDEGIKKLGPLVTLQLCAIDIELQQKHYDGALARLETVASKSPRKETWLARKGEILIRADRTNEARTAFKAALDAMDTLPPGRRNVPAMIDLEKHLRAELEKLGS